MKHFFIFLFASSFIAGCNKHLIQPAQDGPITKDDYIIEARITSSDLPFNGIAAPLSYKVSAVFIKTNEFMNQKEIQFRCTKITTSELNAIIGDLMKYSSIMNFNYYNVNEHRL